jgi:cyclopropane fatty-acyl-phospholipid synthase-like methyltransferase
VNKREITKAIWEFFAPLPLPWRLHQVVRGLVFPVGSLISYLPSPKLESDPLVLLDLGCGHGLFLALAKKMRPDIELVGLDLSEDKIAAARKSFDASELSIRELAVKDIADFSKQSVDVITIIDVLYLVPQEQWSGILRKCHTCLRPGGQLLLKEMDPSVRWKFALLYLEETLAVKALGLTLGRKFTFPSRDKVLAEMERAGFTVRGIPLHRWYYVPHYLWVGSKSS